MKWRDAEQHPTEIERRRTTPESDGETKNNTRARWRDTTPRVRWRDAEQHPASAVRWRDVEQHLGAMESVGVGKTCVHH